MAEMMKDSGSRWIGEIPQSWNTKRIKYMAALKGRIGWQGLTSDEYQEKGAYLITGTDFNNGGIDWDTCVHVPIKRWEEAKEIQIENGDLLITKDGTVGKVAIVSGLPGKASLNSGVLKIMPVKGYSRRFLFWVLQSDVFWNWFHYKNAGNSTILHLYQGDFAEFMYAFPNEDEQKAIANYLDVRCNQMADVTADLEKQIELLKKYRFSIISEAVIKGLDKKSGMKNSGVYFIGSIPENWKIKRIKYIAEFINGDRSDNYPSSDDLVDEGVIFVTSNNIHNIALDTKSTTCKFITQEKYNSLRGAKLKIDDIVYCLRGSVGMCAINKTESDGTIASSLVVIRAKDINADYLNYYLQSSYSLFQRDLYMNGSCAANLSAEDVSTYHITVPTQEEQIDIVHYLNSRVTKIDKVLILLETRLDRIKRCKASLIYEYVTGKKRVKEAP